MHRKFAVLPRWADASALPIKVLMQLTALLIFATESHLALFRFVQSTFSGEETLNTHKKWTLWNLTMNAGVSTMDKRNTEESIAPYSLTTRLLPDCS